MELRRIIVVIINDIERENSHNVLCHTDVITVFLLIIRVPRECYGTRHYYSAVFVFKKNIYQDNRIAGVIVNVTNDEHGIYRTVRARTRVFRRSRDTTSIVLISLIARV